ncbi:AI-2E family transporter [Aureliella helgolandensis]|uniref:Putative inner membrane protein n=1 Tax=Aureliella helgolandensis TaxID=2527968 RepID=A0A518GF10_9BACT|nr:AI-2E family transporter [Aureliella helgolandensis]QDV27184.1 putative inner membrane protein [Aureliella helgolandensis]
MSRLISFAVLIASIVAIGLLFYKVLIGFFVPVFLAAVLVVVFRPLHRWVLEKTGHRDRLAAVATTLLIMLTLMIPVGVVVSMAAVQGLRLIKDNNNPSVIRLRIETIRDSLGLQMPSYEDALEEVGVEIDKVIDNTNAPYVSGDNKALQDSGRRVKQALTRLQERIHVQSGADWDAQITELLEQAEAIGQPDEDDFVASKAAVQLRSQFGKLKTELLGGTIRSLAKEYANPTAESVRGMTETMVNYVRPRLLSITGATGAFMVKLILGSIILIVATFFFLYDGPSMIKSVMRLSPLDDSYEEELLLEFDRISRAVVLATVLSALVQGVTAGVGYYFASMDVLVLLVMLTTIFAMVPFVGPAVVWVPVCLYLGLYEGRIWAASLLAVWGVAVVGTVDNIVKAVVLHGQSQLHPLLALLSVLGGVQTLGPIGIVVGPMVVAMLQTLLSILQRELMHFEGQRVVFSTEGVSEEAVVSKSASAESVAAESPPTATAPASDASQAGASGEEARTEPDSLPKNQASSPPPKRGSRATRRTRSKKR